MVAKYFVCECADMQEFAGRLSVKYSDYEALEARIAELEKDAARYRWLRDSSNYPAGPYWDDLGDTCDPEEMDEMIDDAMSREA